MEKLEIFDSRILAPLAKPKGVTRREIDTWVRGLHAVTINRQDAAGEWSLFPGEWREVEAASGEVLQLANWSRRLHWPRQGRLAHFFRMGANQRAFTPDEDYRDLGYFHVRDLQRLLEGREVRRPGDVTQEKWDRYVRRVGLQL